MTGGDSWQREHARGRGQHKRGSQKGESIPRGPQGSGGNRALRDRAEASSCAVSSEEALWAGSAATSLAQAPLLSPVPQQLLPCTLLAPSPAPARALRQGSQGGAILVPTLQMRRPRLRPAKKVAPTQLCGARPGPSPWAAEPRAHRALRSSPLRLPLSRLLLPLEPLELPLEPPLELSALPATQRHSQA